MAKLTNFKEEQLEGLAEVEAVYETYSPLEPGVPYKTAIIPGCLAASIELLFLWTGRAVKAAEMLGFWAGITVVGFYFTKSKSSSVGRA